MSAAVDRAALIEAAAEAACARVMPRECAVWPEHMARAERSIDAVLPLIADAIAGIGWRNCELRYDGSEDPTTAAWVDGVRNAHELVRSLGGQS